MEEVLNSTFDAQEQIRTKQEQDVYTTLLLGSGTSLMVVLTCQLLHLFAPKLSPANCLIPVVLSLGASVVFWFCGKNDERWYVMSTLLNHVGIGVGLFLLLRIMDLQTTPWQLIYGLLPCILLLVLTCFLLTRSGYRTGALGILLFFAVVILCGFLGNSLEKPFLVILAVCAAVCGGAYCALVWTLKDPGRSIHAAMAVVSFIIYLVLLAVAAILLYLQIAGKDADNSKSSRSKSRENSGGSLFGNADSGTRYRSGGFGRFLFMPTYYYRRPVRRYRNDDAYAEDPVTDGDTPYDPDERRKTSLFLRWAVVILAVLLTAALMYGFLR